MAYKIISGIYKITNIVNWKVYIGSSKNIKKRWNIHRNSLRWQKHRNIYLQRAWNKYGEKNFKFEIILKCLEEELDKKEIKLIQKYKSLNKKFGYNIEEGGRRPIMSEETRNKISRAMKGNKNHLGYSHSEETKKRIARTKMGTIFSKEWKRKISEANSGEKNPFYGKHHSRETIEKIYEANYGRKHSKESKLKMSRSHVGKKFSEEHRRKLSESHKGHYHTKETIRKMSKAKKGRLLSEKHKKKLSESQKTRRFKENLSLLNHFVNLTASSNSGNRI